MNIYFNDIVVKVKKSKTSLHKRKFITKIIHRLKLITAHTLGNIFGHICIFLFISDNKNQNSFKVLLKRKIWQIFCKFYDNQNEGLYLVKSKEDQIHYLLPSS